MPASTPGTPPEIARAPSRADPRSGQPRPPAYSEFPGRALFALARDPIAFFARVAREHGDVVRIRVGLERMYLLNHPEMARDVLVTRQRSFQKGPRVERAKRFFGDGMLTSEGEAHRRLRRLAQPAFHRARLAAYAEVMARYAERASDRWHAGQALDAHAEMTAITLAVVARTLFDSDIDREVAALREALTGIFQAFNAAFFNPFSPILERLPVPSTRRYRVARARLDALVYRLIEEHRRGDEYDDGRARERDDILSMLLLGGAGAPGGEGAMTDLQLRDEVTTFLLAGGETTANALTWAWYLLSSAPDVERRLHAEVDALGGRLPTADDVPRLPYTRMVFAEALRLYPPVWVLGRTTLEPYEAGGYPIPPRSVVLVLPYLLHRDARWFPEPERFDPDRWTPERAADLPRFAYLPFGGGTRTCIGEQFAWLEGVLVLATIARRWRLRLVPGRPVMVERMTALRPRYGLHVVVHRRA